MLQVYSPKCCVGGEDGEEVRWEEGMSRVWWSQRCRCRYRDEGTMKVVVRRRIVT